MKQRQTCWMLPRFKAAVEIHKLQFILYLLYINTVQNLCALDNNSWILRKFYKLDRRDPGVTVLTDKVTAAGPTSTI